MDKLSLIDINKPEKVKNAINELIDYKNVTGVVEKVTRESLGITNVDNTSDMDKPISNIQKQVFDEIKENLDIVESIAKGASVPLWYQNYSEFIEEFNNLEKNTYKSGQNINIVTLKVPDLWIVACVDEYIQFTYTDDNNFVNHMVSNGIVQVGYYQIGMLETQKIDLTDYVKNTDLAQVDGSAGLVKLSNSFGISKTENEEVLYNVPCTDEDINNEDADNYRTLQAKHVSKIVKKGLVNNIQEWTEQEKETVRGFLGIEMPTIIILPEES